VAAAAEAPGPAAGLGGKLELQALRLLVGCAPLVYQHPAAAAPEAQASQRTDAVA
jgi:hypothetical protein